MSAEPPEAKYRDLRQVVEESRDSRRAGKAHIYALEIPMAVIVGAVAGKFVDDRFGVAPWGVGIGLLAGLGAAVRSVYRLIQWMKAEAAADEAASAGATDATDATDRASGSTDDDARGGP